MLDLVLSVIIHNAMPGFWQAWSEPTRAQQIKAFKDRVIVPYQPFYSNGEFSDDLSDDGIADYLAGLKPRERELRAETELVTANLPGAIDDVQRALPELDLTGKEFFIVPSFHHFNGQTSDIPKGAGVFIGIDGLLDFGPSNFSVIVAHELFHMYQRQMHPDENTGTQNVWQAAWIEGTAAYASQYLVKDATPEDALGHTLVMATPEETRALACFIQTHGDSTDRADVREMINNNAHPQNMPARGGYLIGYLAAKNFSATHTLAQLGAAPWKDAEAELKATVTRLCTKGK